MSSKLDFCGLGRVSGPERAGYWGSCSGKPGLANVLSWSSWIFRVHVNCRGFFGLLFSSLFGLFIPRVLDT